MMHADSRRCGVAAVALLGTGALAQTASLTGLGIGNAFQSVANTVSPNGRYVCGAFTTPDNSVAFRWSRQDGLIMLGDLPGGPDISGASGVSNSGIVAGVGTYGFGSNDHEAFTWTPEGGFVRLGDLQTQQVSSHTAGISADGSVVAGVGYPPGPTMAVRWTAAGIEPLGDFPGGVTESLAIGISDDGGTIVGYATEARGQAAFRWTPAGGLENLGELPGGLFRSWAYDTSAHGDVVVGISRGARSNLAFRWTPSTGMVALGALEGGVAGDASYAYAVNQDGSVIVGSADARTDDNAAFYWTPGAGMRKLWDVLREHGLDPATDGWQNLNSAYDVSADGSVIVGSGRRNGAVEGFIAVIPGPCPADFNGDGFLDFFDYNDFTACFEGVCPPGRTADFNADGFADFFDYDDFVAAFQTAC